jgi:ribosomal protein S18 acetylase RimI-like enzyme
MTHPLDRPIWSALTGRQAPLAVRLGDAVRIRPEVGIFAAARDVAAMGDLETLAAFYTGVGFLEAEGSVMVDALPDGATVGMRAVLVQMTADAITPGPSVAWEPLGEADAEAIHDLAMLTRPGPFRPRTMEFGGFIGVKNQGRLIAMAGTRLRCEGYSEVSAVCTHPDHRGTGLAKALMREVAGRIIEAGETAFLHAFADRAATIALYRSLGFEVRQRIVYTVLAEADAAS